MKNLIPILLIGIVLISGCISDGEINTIDEGCQNKNLGNIGDSYECFLECKSLGYGENRIGSGNECLCVCQQICDPSETKCDGNAALECSQDGTKWETEQCKNGCKDGGCIEITEEDNEEIEEKGIVDTGDCKNKYIDIDENSNTKSVDCVIGCNEIGYTKSQPLGDECLCICDADTGSISGVETVSASNPSLSNSELQEICDSMTDNDYKSSCNAIMEGTVEACNSLFGGSFVTRCLRTLAIKENDVTKCDVGDAVCFTSLAIKNKNVNTCNLIGDSYDDEKDTCFAMVAFVTKEDVCPEEGSSYCHKNLAMALADKSICEKSSDRFCQRDVEDVLGQTVCSGDYIKCGGVAIFNNDISICENSKYKERCYNWFIKQHYIADKNLCNLYTDTEYKNDCMLKMSIRTGDASYCETDSCFYNVFLRAHESPYESYATHNQIDIFESQGYFYKFYPR
ncbi:MAG: hypothetical protein GOV02_02475 [Candidatus Aenigmarchaeota archaeon]|nr:hypothetical protein [Candidatus Aenigmarchaeota archaeon]